MNKLPECSTENIKKIDIVTRMESQRGIFFFIRIEEWPRQDNGTLGELMIQEKMNSLCLGFDQSIDAFSKP